MTPGGAACRVPLLTGPTRDPEADVQTTSEQVEQMLDLATVAAGDAQLAWRLLQDALETNTGLDQAARRFETALVESRYRWSVLHDAQRQAGQGPITDAA